MIGMVGRFAFLRAMALFLCIAFACSPVQADVTLRFVPENLTRVLDPHFSTANQVRDFGFMVFDTLFSVDDKFEPHPQMVSEWTVSPDHLTYSFTLRPGLRWHDGTPVTAEDCVASLKRWAPRDSLGQVLLKSTDRLEVVDANTFRLVLKRPFAFVLQAFAKIGAPVPFMMPKRLAETPGNEQIKEIVGSGPFRHVPSESQAGIKLVLVKNQDYVPRKEPPVWASGGKVVKVDRVELLAMPDAATQVSALTKGEVDYLEVVSPDLMPLVERSGVAKRQFINTLGNQALMRMNHLQPPFNDVRVRRAIAMAIDQKSYMQAIVTNPEYYDLCTAMLVCGTRYETAKGAPSRNIEAAKQLIRESGVDLSKPIVMLHIVDSPRIMPIGLVSAELLKSLGFKVDMQAMDFPTFAVRRMKQGPMSEGGWNLAHTTFAASDVVNPLASPPLNASGSSAWWGWPTDSEIERLRSEFAVEEDPAKQKSMAEEIQVRSYDQVLYLPLGQVKLAGALRSNIQGIVQAPAVFFWNIEKK